MIEYTWHFSNCKVIQHSNGFDNIIKSVDWKLIATENQYSVNADGSTEFADPSINFVPFSNITKDIMINWVISGISQENLDAVKKSLVEKLKELQKPHLVQMPLPFD